MPRPDPEYLDDYYSGASDQRDARDAYQKVLEDERAYPNAVIDSSRIAAQCRRLTPGSAFLDVGAGCGFFSRAALEQGFHVTAIEPAKSCRDVYELMNGFQPLPGMLTTDFALAHREAFDVVLMSQVLEHVADVEAAAAHIAALLRPGGIAVIAVPHFGSWLSRLQGTKDMFLVPPEHLSFFSRAGLTTLFERHGFVCCRLHTVSRFNVSRVANRIPLGVALCALGVLRLSDQVNGGMFLNAYFRKQPNCGAGCYPARRLSTGALAT